MWTTFLQFLWLKRFVSTLPTWQGVFIWSDAVAFYWVKHVVRLRGAWPSFRGRRFFHLIPRSWLYFPGLWRKKCPAHHPPRFKALLSVRDRPVEGGISRLGTANVDHLKSPALTRHLMSTQQMSSEKSLPCIHCKFPVCLEVPGILKCQESSHVTCKNSLKF